MGFQHPNVEVIVGDGFKYLADKKNEFDVIITDSSDPEGPAETLFQKPYFELLFAALKEGGVITTQGCSFPSFLSCFRFASMRKAPKIGRGMPALLQSSCASLMHILT